MFALARETGWSRNFIFWELPLDEALQYHHCALRAANCWTIPPMPDASDQIAQMERFAAVDAEDEL